MRKASMLEQKCIERVYRNGGGEDGYVASKIILFFLSQ